MREPKLRGSSLPELSDANLDWQHSKRAIDYDSLLEGITWRRVTAFCIDIAIIGLIFTALGLMVFLSLGLFSPLWALTPFVPVAYHSWMIGSSRSATCGMQVLGIEVRTQNGARPSLLQAFAMTALFYVSIAILTPLILIVALFNDRRRCVHDILSGTIVILSEPDL